jgi:predicted molibdopterin-dependent oxidoreductase YjgC
LGYAIALIIFGVLFEMNTLTLDGKLIEFEPGGTILDIARAHGVHIPTLCHLQAADHKGVCRICVVEVEGSDRLLPACDTPAVNGMVVTTHSEKVLEARKTVLGLLLAEGDHDCPVCNIAGDCRLQDLVFEYGATAPSYKFTKNKRSLDDSTVLIARDFSKCVMCGRCVAACNDVQCHYAIPYPYGRREDKAFPAGWLPKVDLDLCVHCGECVQVCPVGALVESKARFLARPWEIDETIRTTCPYCGVGCQQLLHVKDGRIVKVTGVEDGAPNYGRLCVKGRFGYDFIYSEERLKTPLIRQENGEFREASWDEALDLVATKFKQIIDESGPDALAGVACSRSINEDSYQMQKLFRAVIGTNNIDNCART